MMRYIITERQLRLIMVNNPKDIRWYLKDEATTQLTKGLNQWATELANFIKKNGPDALGK
jgi:hypothetical protein